MRRNLFGAVLSCFVGIVGFFQTQFFVGLLPRPDDDAIRREIVSSQSTQRSLATRYRDRTGKEPSSGIVIKLFSETAQNQVNTAINSIISDDALETELQNSFGATLHDLSVVVVPSWELNSANSTELAGITSYGWSRAAAATAKFDVGGFTIRDRQPSNPLTEDGTPRIVLSPAAFASDRMLRLTLFHGLLHAMNLPGHIPFPLSFAQDDLTYLPVYQKFVAQQRLEGSQQLMVWVLAVILPLVSGILCLRQAFSSYRDLFRDHQRGNK